MDSLDDFEKTLAAEKAERERAAQEKEERRERKHKHHHHHHHRRERSSERDRDRNRDKNSDAEGHRHKRPRRSRDDGINDDGGDDDSSHRPRHRPRSRDRERGTEREREHKSGGKDVKHLKLSDPKEDLPLPDEEKTPIDDSRLAMPLVRDSWMTAPSALDVDYVQRASKDKAPPPKPDEPKRVLHHRELNRGLEADSADQATPTEEHEPSLKRQVNYKFGDEGSQWRMTKLKAVYTAVEQTGRPIDEIAEERFGTLEEFDDAREEKTEMDRRRVYGEGYSGKEAPTGDLYQERMAKTRRDQDARGNSPSPPLEQGVILDEPAPTAAPVDQSALNRMRAQLMKAKLRNAPDTARLEQEYNAAIAAFSAGRASTNAVVLDASYNRMLAGSSRGEVKAVTNKRGVERGQIVANDDMSLDDMVREERRTRGQAGGEGMRLAERIAKDAKFDNDLEYLDENAEKLAKRVHKGEASLKNVAVSEYKKLNRILDTCPLCHHEDRAPPQDQPVAPILALATRVYLTLPTAPELTGAEGGAVVVPINHRTNLLECDDDEWEEIRNFMKSLTRMYHEQGRDVLFYENAAVPQRRLHAALVAVPIPYELGETAPAFFRESMLAADEEWAQHRKIIDTGKRAAEGGLGKMAFRRSIAKEMPYFHVWFTLDGGLAHVVEDASRWPKGDLFAREIIGGMLDCEPDVIKRQGRWTRSDDRIEGFRKRWRKFDWTRVLTEGG
ncbi:CwfJ C-terminus 1-domain-containing protein-like protein [Podospora appendiculata]|uniref:CwfJ C-terminus 1-domain-containing protein-like protein n=1 Tax=Podospora appendiculata TaxID=314037 RepID=A0AAE0X7S5_9PEZI|nr:CwfJ C-terminus 1-domain-containing protein-like protein [Podospora appendiculata]KAK3687580.1 CwfJ C-terminus 1-domain-containing protein-like protein [Podospora appendiculata]